MCVRMCMCMSMCVNVLGTCGWVGMLGACGGSVVSVSVVFCFGVCCIHTVPCAYCGMVW